MKKYTLLLLPLVFSLTGCKSSTYNIKITLLDEHVTVEELKEGNTVVATEGKDLKLHLEGDYIHDINANWVSGKEPTKDDEGELNIPNVEYLIDSSDIQVLVDGKTNDNAFLFAQSIRNSSVLTLKKEFVKNNVEIIIKSHTYTDEMPLCLLGCEITTGIKERYEKNEIQISFESAYQNKMYPIKSLGGEAFPVIEDDTMVITLKVDKAESSEPLPNNIWFRTNARFADIKREFTREYRDNNFECTISVPHYVMKDHCEIRNKE